MATSEQFLIQRPVGTIKDIANILAHGVVRLLQRQNQLDSRPEQSVHDHVLATKGKTA